MARWSVDDSELKAFQRAMGNAEVKNFAVRGTKQVAEAVAKIGTRNLRSREGGGKYSRAVAEVDVVEDSDGWAAGLFTPWLGMEFGGHITNVYGNRVGSGRAKTIGLKPMWATHHRSVEKGYIIGSAWSQVEKMQDPDSMMADEIVAAYDEAFDKAGVRKA